MATNFHSTTLQELQGRVKATHALKLHTMYLPERASEEIKKTVSLCPALLLASQRLAVLWMSWLAGWQAARLAAGCLLLRNQQAARGRERRSKQRG